jgi:hypothetical protein
MCQLNYYQDTVSSRDFPCVIPTAFSLLIVHENFRAEEVRQELQAEVAQLLEAKHKAWGLHPGRGQHHLRPLH